MLGTIGRRLCFMSKVGAISGAIVGAFAEALAYSSGPLTMGEALVSGLVFWLLSLVAVLVLFGVWLRYGVGSIWAQVVLASLPTAVLVVLVQQHWGPLMGLLVGYVLGIVVGMVICAICRLVESQLAESP